MPQRTAAILIVEDEQLIAMDLEAQLNRLGHRVAGLACTGEDAIAAAIQCKPDLVLMDVRLAGSMDGIDAAREISRTCQAPVVFLTAYADIETLRRASLAEPYGYLVKPFDQRDLEAAVEISLHKAEADRRLRRNRDDLRTILDAQRQGTIMIDAAGRVVFASRAACRMASVDEATVLGKPLGEMLPLADNQLAALEGLWNLPVEDRGKMPVVLGAGEPRPRHLEIEVLDDSRSGGGRIVFLYDVSPLVDLRRQLDDRAAFHNILGKSKSMQQVFQFIRDVAGVDSTVLIEGETGTGKELVARAIHECSRRRDGPLVALNCAGLPEELAASQLFGHRRGAFTGAMDDQQGLFEAASGGTLFLDEIGDLPSRVQTTLLRVLEERSVRRLGETRLQPVNVRVLAATNRDLTREAAEGRFRQDLLYRIRVARVRLPPLRDRREDLPLLVRAFLADHRATTGKQVDAVGDDAMAVLMDYEWPGNVRELRNALEFAVIRASGSVIDIDDLPPEVLEACPLPPAGETGPEEAGRIFAALERARGNRTRAAAILGISRATFYRRLKELGIGEE
ncbi:MAG: sigma 54-interacting transcriptional regulator [Thermoguttaceae bacterium]|nr:sigma 54-interacting transcriptional regulator [Thermoguttaceae bacterium]